MNTLTTRFSIGARKGAPVDPHKVAAWKPIRDYLIEHGSALGATLAELVPEDYPGKALHFVYYCYHLGWIEGESAMDAWLRGRYPKATDRQLDDMARGS